MRFVGREAARLFAAGLHYSIERAADPSWKCGVYCHTPAAGWSDIEVKFISGGAGLKS